MHLLDFIVVLEYHNTTFTVEMRYNYWHMDQMYYHHKLANDVSKQSAPLKLSQSTCVLFWKKNHGFFGFTEVGRSFRYKYLQHLQVSAYATGIPCRQYTETSFFWQQHIVK